MEITGEGNNRRVVLTGEEKSRLVEKIREHFEGRAKTIKECEAKGHPDDFWIHVNSLEYPTHGYFRCPNCGSSYERPLTQKERDDAYTRFHSPMTI